MHIYIYIYIYIFILFVDHIRSTIGPQEKQGDNHISSSTDILVFSANAVLAPKKDEILLMEF
jgi:hypothetical protein